MPENDNEAEAPKPYTQTIQWDGEEWEFTWGVATDE
jgi:hypothetical protein